MIETELKPTVPELLDKLTALGDQDQIAIYLENQGITAMPCNSGECAIAVYLKRETGIDELAVGDVNVVAWHSGAVPNMVHRLSHPLQDFVSSYDQLDYPTLIDWSKGVPVNPPPGFEALT